MNPGASVQMFPAFGFGGKFRGQVSHCFALNGNEAEPEVHGIAGVLQVYRSAIRTYELAGPTYFSEVGLVPSGPDLGSPSKASCDEKLEWGRSR